VANPNLNAQIMAEKLAFALERGWHFRRAGHSTIRRVMESGARGCHIIIAGKLTGQRHRTEKFKEGYIKFCGEPKLMDVEKGYAIAKLKPGVIGVTVEIMRPGAKLPDEIDITLPAEASEKFPELAPLMVKKEEPSPIVPLEENVEIAEDPAPVDMGTDVKEGDQ
jgi:small subunit ribosomal protein S3